MGWVNLSHFGSYGVNNGWWFGVSFESLKNWRKGIHPLAENPFCIQTVIWENSIQSNQNPSCHFGRGASKPPTTWRSWSATARELCPDPKDNPSSSLMHPPSLSPKNTTSTHPQNLNEQEVTTVFKTRRLCQFAFICLDFTCFARKSELFTFIQYNSCAWVGKKKPNSIPLFSQVSVLFQPTWSVR